MRSLPPQHVHLSFEPGPYRMAMGLVTVDERDWFEIDERYPEEMQERRQLLRERRQEVFAALQGSAAACAETLREVAGNLTGFHPDWFQRSGPMLQNRLTGETWDLERPGYDPLELAGRLVQEDLCIIQLHNDVPVLTAAVLCFPSRWRLWEKMGLPLTDVHKPVPFYGEKLARPVDRFMRHVKTGHIASRLNWSVLDDPALFQPTGKWRKELNSDVTAQNAGERLFLRVERQTLRRLPESGAVLFGIRVHVYPLVRAIRTRELAEQLADAVRALPAETIHYKSFRPIKEGLLGWLAAR